MDISGLKVQKQHLEAGDRNGHMASSEEQEFGEHASACHLIWYLLHMSVGLESMEK